MSKISQLESGLVVVESESAKPGNRRRTAQERFAEFPEEALNELYCAMMSAWQNDNLKAIVVQSHVIRAREILSENGIEVEQLC